MTSSAPQDNRSIWRRVRERDLELLADRELLALGVVLALAVAALLWVIFTYFEPPPPKRVTIVTGGESGAYFAYAKRYAAEFRKQGITLEVKTSKGSVENLAALVAPAPTAMIGLMQSGIGDAENAPQLESLASIAYEPIWVLYKPKSPTDRVTTLASFAGKRIAIGPDGSGTRVAALKLLRVNEMTSANTSLSEQTGSDAVQALLDGKVDAAFIVAAADAPSIVQALTAGLRTVSFERADAYVRLLPWLSKVILPRGVISLPKDLPSEDVQLIASTANLVVHKDLHPAIVYLLMDVASEIHKVPTIVNGLREFPSEKSLDFPQSAESQRFFKNGRPFLQRYLPFWLANLLERLSVTLLPALAIVIPLVQLLPKLMSWREKSRLLKLYHEIDLLQASGVLSPTDPLTALAHLDRIEAELAKLKFGATEYIDVYNLRSHLDMMRSRSR
jgi:TRAP transporter TAXI family solute receptor